MKNDLPNGPIEVWLSQPNMEVTCRVVYEDESVKTPDVYSLTMRGAQREMTGWFISQGYQPVGRWQYEDQEVPESYRRFTPAKDTDSE